MNGVYQHCKEKHLRRCLAEFDFRYSNCVGPGVGDVPRADRALKGIVGKTLTYRTPSFARNRPMTKKGEKQKPRPKIKDKKQSERLKETARRIGADRESDIFARIVTEVAKQPPKPRRTKK